MQLYKLAFFGWFDMAMTTPTFITVLFPLYTSTTDTADKTLIRAKIQQYLTPLRQLLTTRFGTKATPTNRFETVTTRATILQDYKRQVLVDNYKILCSLTAAITISFSTTRVGICMHSSR